MEARFDSIFQSMFFLFIMLSLILPLFFFFYNDGEIISSSVTNVFWKMIKYLDTKEISRSPITFFSKSNFPRFDT